MEINADNINNINNTINKRVKNKKKVYETERKQILNEFLNVLGINENNKELSLYELEHNEELKNTILNFKTRLSQYFCTSEWPCFKHKSTQRVHLAMIRALLKDMDIDYQTKRQMRYINQKQVIITIYVISHFNY